MQQESRTKDEDAEVHRSVAWDRRSPEAVLLVAVRSLRDEVWEVVAKNRRTRLDSLRALSLDAQP